MLAAPSASNIPTTQPYQATHMNAQNNVPTFLIKIEPWCRHFTCQLQSRCWAPCTRTAAWGSCSRDVGPHAHAWPHGACCEVPVCRGTALEAPSQSGSSAAAQKNGGHGGWGKESRPRVYVARAKQRGQQTVLRTCHASMCSWCAHCHIMDAWEFHTGAT